MTGEVLSGYRLLRELGARALPAYAALDPKAQRPADALCVVEQLVRGGDVGAEGAAVFLRDAKRLEQLHHANVVRVRDVVVASNTVLLVSDWIDGETLADVDGASILRGSPLPMAATLRIFLDVLEGLSALHELRDARREPLGLVHAEVSPRNIVIGLDGRAVLTHLLHVPEAEGGTKRSAADAAGYLAPEALLGDQTLDQRADVFGAGVILWEALMGRRMHARSEDVGEVVMRILGGKIEAPVAPADAPWAEALAEAAKRAIAADPSVRFPNATAMLTEVRRAIGARAAARPAVASLVEASVGARIRARRAELRPTDLESTPLVPVSARAELPSVPVTIDDDIYEDAATVVVTLPASVRPPSSRGGAAPASRTPTPLSTSVTSPRPSPAPASRTPTPLSSPAISSRPSPAPSATKMAAPLPIASLGDDALDVVDVEVPPDRPSKPRAPPPFRPRESSPKVAPAVAASSAPPATQASSQPAPPTRLTPAGPVSPTGFEAGSPASVRVPMASKTDVGSISLDATTGALTAPGSSGRTRWAVVLVCVVAIAVIAWLALRGGEHPDSADVPPPASTILEPSPSPPASAVTPGVVAAAAGSAPADGTSATANEAPPADDKPSTAASARTPKEIPPFPVVAPATPPASTAPAPAASSPHAKKRVYDPMGI